MVFVDDYRRVRFVTHKISLVLLYGAAALFMVVGVAGSNAAAIIAGLLCFVAWVALAAHGPFSDQDTTTKEPEMPFTPTYEMACLSQKVVDGYLTALRLLWPLLYPDVPFDKTWSLEDIARDISVKFEEYNAAQAAKAAAEAEPEPEPGVVPEFSDGMTPLMGAAVLAGAIISASKARKTAA